MQSIVVASIREGEENTLPTEIKKVIWDNAATFEKEIQSWWYLVTFTCDPINNQVTDFVFTIHNISVYAVYQIIGLELNHNGDILCPLVWPVGRGRFSFPSTPP